MFLIAFCKTSLLVTKWLAGNIVTVFLTLRMVPVTVSNSQILSISSPKNSILIPLLWKLIGIISTISPLTLKVPLLKSILLRSYNIFTSFSNTSSLSIAWAVETINKWFLYSSISPIP